MIPLSKVETERLDSFDGLSLEQVIIPRKAGEFAIATKEIITARIVGFDTESKPTFNVGEKNTGPHVVQFALECKAFIFHLSFENCLEPLKKLLGSDKLLKVGFGLNSDRRFINRKLGTKIVNVLDLNHVFKKQGYPGAIGARAAVGIVLKKKFHKPKKVAISNWGNPRLSKRQLLYAANDAYVALKVFQGLKLS